MKKIVSDFYENVKIKDILDNKLESKKKQINVASYKPTFVNWHNEYSLWVYWLPSTMMSDAYRYWFGITELNITYRNAYSQIIGFTFPYNGKQIGGLNRRRTGCFIKDKFGNYYIGHRGRVGGENRGTLLKNPKFSSYIEDVADGDKINFILVVAKINDNESLLEDLRKFIFLVAREYHAKDYLKNSIIFRNQKAGKINIVKLNEEIYSELENKTKTEKDAIIKQRIGQSKLREKLLHIYENKCAMCDVDNPMVLRASHIVKWSEDESNRLNLRNVILLCGLHDLAFENDFIEIDDEYKIRIKCDDIGLKSVLNKITLDHLSLPKNSAYYPSKELLRKKRNE